MDFFQMICLLCPAAIPTILESKKENKLLLYMIYVMSINFLNLSIVYFISNNQYITFTPLFSMKYMVLGFVNAIICYIFKLTFNKCCNIEISVETNKKKERKNAKKNN